MKRYLKLGLNLIFFISSLLFLDKNIALIISVLLICYLELEDIRFSFLPLALAVVYQNSYSAVLVIIYLLLFFSYFKLRGKRIYLLLRFIVILCITNIAIYSLNNYSLLVLYISLITFIIYSLLCLAYIVEDKRIIPTNDKLAFLILCLFYLLILVMFKVNYLIIGFLFLQLFLLGDTKYNILFSFLYILIYYIVNHSINITEISVFSSSYFPPFLFLYFEYNNLIVILYSIYIALALFTRLENKRIIINEAYINKLFTGFKSYIDMINIEKNKLEANLELKERHIKYCMDTYCNKCFKATECKLKLDIRYQFILEGLRGGINKYGCPYFDHFYLNEDNKKSIKSYEHDALYDLADELEYIYSQSLLLESSYNKLLYEVVFYGYLILDIDIYLKEDTTYFKIKLSKKKKIAKGLLTRIAQKSFREDITLKIIENENDFDLYFYKTPKCHIDYSHIILAKENNIVSGDNYFIKKNYNDSYIFALSDGMGSGHNAYLESSRTLELLSKLATGGFSIRTVLKLLEDILSLRSDYDSYATLDMLALNTSQLKAKLFKLGSTVTYLFHNDEIIEYQNRALPLKLDDINSAYEIELCINDIIILLSDGISDYISKAEIKELVDYSLATNIILDRIVNKIKQKYNNSLRDDLSLIIIKIVS